MKRFLVGLIAIGGLMGMPALAADMAVKAPPPAPVPVALWTGFFVGGKVGGGFGEKWWNCTPATDCDGGPNQSIGKLSSDGFIGGFVAGYNWQTGPWVFGVEGQWDWTDMHGQFTGSIPGFEGETLSSRIHWIATLIGRVGFTIDRTLFYAGGGAAWMRETDTDSDGVESFTGTATSTGFTILTGVEYMLVPHLQSGSRVTHISNYRDSGAAPLGHSGSELSFLTRCSRPQTPLRLSATRAGPFCYRQCLGSNPASIWRGICARGLTLWSLEGIKSIRLWQPPDFCLSTT